MPLKLLEGDLHILLLPISPDDAANVLDGQYAKGTFIQRRGCRIGLNVAMIVCLQKMNLTEKSAGGYHLYLSVI